MLRYIENIQGYEALGPETMDTADIMREAMKQVNELAAQRATPFTEGELQKEVYKALDRIVAEQGNSSNNSTNLNPVTGAAQGLPDQSTVEQIDEEFQNNAEIVKEDPYPTEVMG